MWIPEISRKLANVIIIFSTNTICSDLVVVDSMKEEGERFEEDKSSHDPVDPEHLLCPILLEDEDPEATGEKEEDGEHLVQSWERHLSSREVTV